MASLLQLLAVAEYLNFRHAAKALGVSQSSVSTRIKLLEGDLGITLFERLHRGVRLTEAGYRFVTEISTGIEQLDYAMKTASEASDGTIGRIGIGLHASIASGFLADLRRIYRARHPLIEQCIVEGRSSDTIKLVRQRKIDVAFVMGAIDAPDCHTKELWHESFVMAVPTGHSLSKKTSVKWDELARDRFLVRHAGVGPQFYAHVSRRMIERTFAPRIRQCDVARDTLMHMVADGEGVALTLDTIASIPFPGVVFLPITDEPERARFSAVWSPSNRSPTLRNMLSYAVEMRQKSTVSAFDVAN